MTSRLPSIGPEDERTVEPRPIYLLADSQLLFWKSGESRFLHSMCEPHLAHAPRAAYIGASNGDAPEYYELFHAAMEGIGIGDCRMIRSSFPPSDRAFLSGADIVMLAGGDVDHGWRVLVQTGMKDLLLERYQAGATLMGISAGAVHLGLYGAREREERSAVLFETLALCPFIAFAHGEREGWPEVSDVARLLDAAVRGIGIPSGAGVIHYPDRRIEAVRYPAYDFRFERGAVVSRSLIPVGTAFPPQITT